MTFQAHIAAAQFGPTEKNDRSDTDNRHNGRSEPELLVEVGDALGKVREVAEGSRDRMLLYFIDMAIFQVCESLRSELTGMTGRPSAPLRDEAPVG